jgi:hypothetical protein
LENFNSAQKSKNFSVISGWQDWTLTIWILDRDP